MRTGPHSASHRGFCAVRAPIVLHSFHCCLAGFSKWTFCLGLLLAFFSGLASVVLLLEAVTMDSPPVAHRTDLEGDSSENDSSDGICPPNATTGINLLLAANTLVEEVAYMMELSREEPFLFRFTDNTNRAVDFGTRIAVLNYPRRLNLWVDSYMVYERLSQKISGLEHAEWPLLSEQIQRQQYTVRLYVHYKSLHQTIEDFQRENKMLRDTISSMDVRLGAMEALVRGYFSSTSSSSAPPVVAPPPCSIWSQPSMSQDDETDPDF